MSTSPLPRPRHSVTPLLVALILASVATLGLLVPSVRAAISREEPPLTGVSMRIAPLSAQQPKDCPELSDARLNRSTTAVLATFTVTQAGVASFTVKEWFRGGPADLVRLSSTSPVDLEQALAAAKLDKGQVLIASRSSEVLLCGESAPYSASLAAKYYRVFEQTAPPSSSPTS
ncbi:MAG: hypothetical protein V9G19_24570 [Tetrasphaera sp.]